jgi:hypothetical protein
VPPARNCSEARLGLVNQVSDLLDEDVQSQEYRAAIHVPVLGAGEAYVHGEVQLHIHIGVRAGGINEDPYEFCALLQRLPDELGVTDSAVLRDELNVDVERQKDAGVEYAVLVDSGEESEHREGVSLGAHAVRSRVWLFAVDECPVGSTDVLKHRFGSLALPVAGADTNGPSGRAGRLRLRLQGELPGNVIQRGTDLMENVPDENAPTEDSRLFILREAERHMASLRVVLAGESVRVTAHEGSRLSIERFQVLTSTVNLGPSAV